jgi:stage V sporulation protein G
VEFAAKRSAAGVSRRTERAGGDEARTEPPTAAERRVSADSVLMTITDKTANLDDTTSITVELIALRPVKTGRIIAFADVRLGVDGVEFVVHGVQVSRAKDAGKEATKVSLPTYRDAHGNWTAAISLPNELREPMARIVLDACLDAGLCRRVEAACDQG